MEWLQIKISRIIGTYIKMLIALQWRVLCWGIDKERGDK